MDRHESHDESNDFCKISIAPETHSPSGHSPCDQDSQKSEPFCLQYSSGSIIAGFSDVIAHALQAASGFIIISSPAGWGRE
jgi:hypothetical protein